MSVVITLRIIKCFNLFPRNFDWLHFLTILQKAKKKFERRILTFQNSSKACVYSFFVFENFISVVVWDTEKFTLPQTNTALEKCFFTEQIGWVVVRAFCLLALMVHCHITMQTKHGQNWDWKIYLHIYTAAILVSILKISIPWIKLLWFHGQCTVIPRIENSANHKDLRFDHKRAIKRLLWPRELRLRKFE